MKLTATTLANIRPTERRQELPDSLCPGLYLTVQPSGKMSWQVRYRHGGVQRRMTLGRYPALSLANARQRARDAQAAASDGRDPAAELKAAKAPRPKELNRQVPAVLDLYVKRHLSGKRSGGEVEAILRRETAVWGDRDIRSISKADIIEMLDTVLDRGTPVAANRLRAYLSGMFNWAQGRDILTVSPLDGIKPPAPETARDRVLSDDEIRLFWNACERLGHPFGPLYRVLLLTGQRLREVAEMERGEIDGRDWHLPASRSKNGDAHTVPLSPKALEILNALPRTSDTFLFSTTGETPVSGFARAKRRLDQLIHEALNKGQPEDAESVPIPAFTIHDLRRTAATGMARLRFPPHIVEAALNHKSGSKRGVAGVYNRFDYAEEKRAALEAWARFVMSIVEGKAQNVVQLAGAQ